VTFYELPRPRTVLNAALEDDVQPVVVVGRSQDGAPYVSSSQSFLDTLTSLREAIDWLETLPEEVEEEPEEAK
jgi:hypothetical protein